MNKKFLAIILSVMALVIAFSAFTVVSAESMTAYRGDTITFSATIPESMTVGSGSLSISYNGDALELTGGSCNVSGAMLATFDSAKGKGGFAFSGTGTVSGSLFTATFRVKDSAAFGTYQLSLNVTLKDESNTVISSVYNTASVTVACNHSFTKEDTTYLKSAATCTSPALYYKSCATCGAQGTEAFTYGTTVEHSYTRQVITDAYKVSGATCTAKAIYKHCCATCDKAGVTTFEYGSTLAHNYTRKVVTDTYKKSDATCNEAAVYYYSCATCDAMGTTTYTNGSKLGHTGGTATCTAKAECTRCHELYGTTLAHTYDQKVAQDKYLASAASCTENAKYYKSCSCGEKGSATFEYGSTKEHSYTKQVTTDMYKVSGATCTAKAVYKYCCITCDKAGTETFEYGTTLDHNFTRKVVTDTYKKSAATCTDVAVYYYCCATCDAKGSTTYTNGSELGHTGGTATCTAKAECSRCHELYGTTLAHTYDKEAAQDKYLASAASCTEKAKYYKSCSCGEKGSATFEYGSTKEHSYTKQVTTDTYKVSGATCTAKAVYYYCCATCDATGANTYEHGTTLSHSYTRKVVTDTYKKSAATCTDAAVYYYCCSTCDAKSSITYTNGAELGHTGGTATCTAKAECSRCHELYGETLEHVYNQEVAQDKYLASAASCTAKAKYYKSCSCGDKGTVTFEYGEKKAHTNTQKVDDLYLKSAATCTAKAVYYESCSVCGEKGTATFESGNAPSHSYKTNWNSNASSHWHECSKCGDKKDTTSHTAGAAATEYTAQTCTVCGYVITPAMGHTHNYRSSWSKDTENHWHSCSGCSTPKDKSSHSYKNACDTDCDVCGYVRTITHSYNAEWSKDAEKHWYECSVCGDKKNETAHTPGADATETTDQTCTVCGYVIKKALGHAYDYESFKSDEVNHWNECSCGAKTNVMAHNWNDGVIIVESTYEATGEKFYTCTVCSVTKTETIAMLVKVEEIVAPDNSDVKITMPEGSTAVLNENTVIQVEEIKDDVSADVKVNVQAVVGNDKAEVLASYDISLLLDGATVQPGGTVEVTLPAPENTDAYDAIQVVYVDDEGNVTPCETKVNADGTITFVTDHFSYYAIVGVQNAFPTIGIVIAILGIALLVGGAILLKKRKA